MPADLTGWVDRCLVEHGIRRTGPLEVHRERVWAGVLRAPTDGGPVWLKRMPPPVAYEARLYGVLVARVPDRVLTPLGADPERGLLLLPDAGPTLAEQVVGAELSAATAVALRAYATIQQALTPFVDELVACGLTDMGPSALPVRFDETLDFAVGYARRIGADARPLLGLRPWVAERCEELASRGRPSMLDHNDLHAHNVIGSPAAPRFLDWGDAVLAHPFACLLMPLDNVPAADRPTLRDAYLSAFGDAAALRAEAELAVTLSLIGRTLVWLRALGPDAATHEHAAAPWEHLQRLLAASQPGRRESVTT